MIGYGLRTLYVNNIYEMKNNKGKILQCGLGHNSGFATIFWFRNFDCEYYYHIKEGDKVEIPKGIIEIQETEFKGKKNAKMIIKTDWVQQVSFNDSDSKENKPKEKVDELDDDDDGIRFDDSMFGDNKDNVKKDDDGYTTIEKEIVDENVDLSNKSDEELDKMMEEASKEIENDWEKDL